MKCLRVLLIFFVSSALSHEQNFDVQSGKSQGIKSYGGVFHDPQNYQNSQQVPVHVPVSYQPYGWNFHNQPQRTYGGVIRQNQNVAPSNTQSNAAGFGWAGQGNQFNGLYYPGSAGAPFPQFPFFQPAFPQFNFQNAFPYPAFPNNFPFPNYNNPHAGGNQPGGHQPSGHQPGGHQPSGHQPGGHQPSGHQPGGYQPSGHQTPQHPNHQVPMNPTHGVNYPDHQTPNHPAVSPQRPGGSFYPDHQQPVDPNIDTLFPDNNQDVENHHRGSSTPRPNVQRPAVIPHPTTQRPHEYPRPTTQRPHEYPQPTNPSTMHTNSHPGASHFPDSGTQTHTKPTEAYLPPATVHYLTTKKPNLDNDQEFHPNKIDSGENRYPTDAFFSKDKKRPVNLDRNPWTEGDELAWQATTQKPYFENRIPILGCTMPASAILGATTAMGASNLLPLRIPVGKPIISCNATDLAQIKISLDGTVYDCNQGDIVKFCPRADYNGQINDMCAGDSMQCDVALTNTWKNVFCTNGTMISNHPIICTSFTLMKNNNALNCLYDSRGTPEPKPVHPTSRPQSFSDDRNSVVPLAPVTENTIEDFDTRVDYNVDSMPLNHQVRVAMSSVFPHELLTNADSRKMYLPPDTLENPQMPFEIKNHLNGVFPHELFALSQKKDDVDDYGDVSTFIVRFGGEDENIQGNRLTEQQRGQWNFNQVAGNPTGHTKTKNNGLQSRFGSNSEPTPEDRLVFTP